MSEDGREKKEESEEVNTKMARREKKVENESGLVGC